MRCMINHGDPQEARSCRVRLLRYFVLAWIFSLRTLSRPILLRFKPTDKLSQATLQQKLAVLNCDPCTLALALADEHTCPYACLCLPVFFGFSGFSDL